MLRYLLSCVVVLALAATSQAEVYLISFGNLKTCEYCIAQEQIWQSPEAKAKMKSVGRDRVYVDTSTREGQKLRDTWGVQTIPTTYLVDVDAETKKLSILRKNVGLMSRQATLNFVEVP